MKTKTKKKPKKPKKPTKTKLIKELDRVFSIHIRKRDTKNGYISCYCCRKKIEFKDSQNMHYISRANMSTRWDEKNCRAGCVGCNVFRNGNYPAYTFHLLKEIGEKGLKELEKKGKQIKQWSIQDLENEILKYKV